MQCEGGGTMTSIEDLSIEGSVSSGFEPVRETFAENIARRHELGWRVLRVSQRRGGRGPLGRGSRTRETSAVWGRGDTMVLVYSATKGLAAMTLALAHSRGWLDYDERVASYWPEFAQQGKGGDYGAAAPRASGGPLCHQRAGRSRRRRRPRSTGGDHGSSAAGLGAGRAAGLPRDQPRLLRERAAPSHRPAASQPRAVLPRGDGRTARASTSTSARRRRFPVSVSRRSATQRLGSGCRDCLLGLSLLALSRRSVLHRSLVANPGTGFYVDPDGFIVRGVEAPSGGGRRECARDRKGVRRVRQRRCSSSVGAPRRSTCAGRRRCPSRHGYFDECLRCEAKFSLGFMKPSESFPFGHVGGVRCGPVPAVRWARGSRGRHRLRIRHEPHGNRAQR